MRSLKQDPAFNGDFAETGGEGVEEEDESASQSQFLNEVQKRSRRSWECSGTIPKMN